MVIVPGCWRDSAHSLSQGSRGKERNDHDTEFVMPLGPRAKWLHGEEAARKAPGYLSWIAKATGLSAVPVSHKT